MKMNKVTALLLISFIIMPFSSFAAYVRVDGKWSNEKYAPIYSVSEHYDKALQYFNNKKWEEALEHFITITLHFQNTPFYADALYNSGVCYFNLKNLNLASEQFDHYLNLGGTLKHFEKVFEYKFEIANLYSTGVRKPAFGLKQLPKIASGKKDALDLYDQIIASLPNKEIAAKSYYGKAKLLRNGKEYRESIEVLNTLIKRFPKSSLAADAFVLISDIYVEQSKIEAQNPDLLSLAYVNLTRFQKQFPGDKRISQVEINTMAMKEFFAKSLYETGKFYEKKKKSHASAIYYREAIKRYPEAKISKKCQERLAYLDKVTKPLA